jgi:NAD(P)-dependent dehydrogenase (short-subunit alcohol dehydrogenase family)
LPRAGVPTSLRINTDYSVWQQVFQVNFFAPIMLARGLVEELLMAY